MEITDVDMYEFAERYMCDFTHDDRIAEVDDYDCVLEALSSMDESLRCKFEIVFGVKISAIIDDRNNLWRECLREAFENYLKSPEFGNDYSMLK